MNNSQTSNTNELIYIEFEKGQSDFITPEELKTISGPVKKREFEGNLVSIKKFKPLKDQSFQLDELVFELKTNVSILNSLVKSSFDLDEKPREYVELLNNISIFIHSNIIEIANIKLNELNSVLEFEENKELKANSI